MNAPVEILSLREYIEANTINRRTRRELHRGCDGETTYRWGVEEAIVAAQAWLTEQARDD